MVWSDDLLLSIYTIDAIRFSVMTVPVIPFIPFVTMFGGPFLMMFMMIMMRMSVIGWLVGWLVSVVLLGVLSSFVVLYDRYSSCELFVCYLFWECLMMVNIRWDKTPGKGDYRPTNDLGTGWECFVTFCVHKSFGQIFISVLVSKQNVKINEWIGNNGYSKKRRLLEIIFLRIMMVWVNIYKFESLLSSTMLNVLNPRAYQE